MGERKRRRRRRGHLRPIKGAGEAFGGEEERRGPPPDSELHSGEAANEKWRTDAIKTRRQYSFTDSKRRVGR